jgi:hypothetical protein
MAIVKAAKSSESYEAKRKVEVLEMIRGLDRQMAALLERLRVFRKTCLVKHRAGSGELSDLEDERIALAARRDAVLREYATL